MTIEEHLAELVKIPRYTVLNNDGKYLSVGLYWTTDPLRVKFYNKPGPAKAFITRAIRYSKGKNVPHLVEIIGVEATILNDSKRTDKIVEAEKKRNSNYPFCTYPFNDIVQFDGV
jgi:hypothetical protein